MKLVQLLTNYQQMKGTDFDHLPIADLPIQLRGQMANNTSQDEKVTITMHLDFWEDNLDVYGMAFDVVMPVTAKNPRLFLTNNCLGGENQDLLIIGEYNLMKRHFSIAMALSESQKNGLSNNCNTVFEIEIEAVTISQPESAIAHISDVVVVDGYGTVRSFGSGDFTLDLKTGILQEMHLLE